MQINVDITGTKATLRITDRLDDGGFIKSGKLTIDGLTTEFTAAEGDYHPVYAALKDRGYRFDDRYDDEEIEIDENETATFDVQPLDLPYLLTRHSTRKALETLSTAGVTAKMYAEYLRRNAG